LKLNSPILVGSKAAERKKRLDHHFQDLSKTYLDRRCAISSQFKFDDFSNTVAKFTQYESLQVNKYAVLYAFYNDILGRSYFILFY